MEDTKRIICIDCGKKFELPKYSRQKRCDKCKKEHQKNLYLARREKKIKRKNLGKNIPLMEICEEIREYNEKHGTRLTYGQYVNLTTFQKCGKM